METFLWTLLLLGVLIFIHELGHFLAAKWAGISVPRFSRRASIGRPGRLSSGVYSQSMISWSS